MPIEWFLLSFALLAAVYLVTRRLRGLGGWPLAISILLLGISGGFLWQKQLQARQSARKALLDKIPREGRAGYVTSDSCRSCHPAQYDSWHKSFHRTMTQHATPEGVRGDFNGTKLNLDGELYALERRGNEYWVEMVDPDWKYIRLLQRERGMAVPVSVEPPRVWKRVSMLTGSHHMQAYWIPSKYGNLQYSLPFTYLFADQRWVPRNDVFLLGPNAPHAQQFWNATCINCHSTAGHARQDPDTKIFDTRAAELGISCEACHGPAEEHVRRYSDPLLRYTSHQKKQKASAIVNPAKLDHVKSSETCSRCHAIRFNPRPEQWNMEGIVFEPGGELESNAPLMRRHDYHLPDSPEARRLTATMEGSFWSDGQVRVSGREFNGMRDSGCFKRGELSCVSCHSMHKYADTDDQLATRMEGNVACFQCHSQYAAKLQEHTHHAPNSGGSLCYNCHMPHTSYGLLKAIRSHTINSPSVASSLKTGRPNACNLCHMDKSLGWAQEYLTTWYGSKQPSLSEDEKKVPASVLWLLRGDAGQRALVAWHMGWSEAHKASGSDWLVPYLAESLTDTYAVVRYIGQRSLKRLPAFQGLDYDYIGDAGGRARVREEVLRKSSNPSIGPEAFARLLGERKDPRMELFE